MPRLAALFLLGGVLAIGSIVHAGKNDREEAKSTKEAARIDPQAVKVLRAMGEHLGKLKAFSFEADETVEVVPEDFEQKIQLTNIRRLVVSRPRLAGSTRGDSAELEYVYDGKKLHIVDYKEKTLVEIPFEGALDKLLDHLFEKYQLQMPLADLLFPKPDIIFLENAKRVRYLGQHMAVGLKCHHLAGVMENLDWQVWIEAGEKPWPRKLVLVYKKQSGMPTFEATLRRWTDKPEVKENTFEFKAPAGVKKVEPLATDSPLTPTKKDEPKKDSER